MFPNPIGWGFDRLDGWVRGAAGDITENIFSSLAGWILNSAVGLFGLVSVAVFSNDSVADGCTIDTVAGCSRASFVADTFGRSRTVAAVLLVLFTMWTIGRAALGGDVGALGRKFFFDVPKAVILVAVILQVTIVMLLVTDEISAFLLHPALAPDRAEFFEMMTALGDHDGGNAALASFTIVLLGSLLAVGSLGLWVLMMLRSAAIAILVTLAPLLAAASVTSYAASMQKLMKLLIAMIGMKVVIVLCMSLGVSAVMNMPWVRGGLDAQAVVAEAPTPPGEAPPGIVEPAGDDFAEATSVAYTLATGALVVFGSLFSPMLIMQLIPDSLEQYYAFGQGGRLMSRANGGLRGAGSSVGGSVRSGGSAAVSHASNAGRRWGSVSTSGIKATGTGRMPRPR